MTKLLNTLLLTLIAALLAGLFVLELNRRGTEWQDGVRLDLYTIERNVYAVCLELAKPAAGETVPSELPCSLKQD